MNIKEALFTEVSGLVSGRMYPGRLPQEPTYPALTYRKISARGTIDHSGPSDFQTDRFQFNCHGSYSEATTLVRSLRQALEGFNGDMNGVTVWGIFYQNEVDLFGQITGIDFIAVDFKVVYKEVI